YVGWIQTAAGFALFMSFLVIFLTRSAVGEAVFGGWGWRIPFLISIGLLGVFGLMAVQGVLFYTAHFYSQFFLTQILKVDGATVTFVMMVVTAISVFLYLFFSLLSDRIGRKIVILTGTILSVVTAFPLFHALADAPNPAVAAAQRAAPVTVVADASECLLQFDPVGQAGFVSAL